VHGPSVVVDPRAYHWQHADWRGRPWAEAVVYQLPVGTFSPDGTCGGVRERLDHLAPLGVTAIELMPIAEFPGGRNWGRGTHLVLPAEWGHLSVLQDVVSERDVAVARGGAVTLATCLAEAPVALFVNGASRSSGDTGPPRMKSVMRP
jgi:hypothetical protein